MPLMPARRRARASPWMPAKSSSSAISHKSLGPGARTDRLRKYRWRVGCSARAPRLRLANTGLVAQRSGYRGGPYAGRVGPGRPFEDESGHELATDLVAEVVRKRSRGAHRRASPWSLLRLRSGHAPRGAPAGPFWGGGG